MRKSFLFLLLLLMCISWVGSSFRHNPHQPVKVVAAKKVVIGYVGGFRGPMNVDSIHAEKLTHINYAFATIENNRIYLPKIASDTVNLRKLHNLLQKNPTLKIMVSVGGWTGCRNFSDMALTDSSRRGFTSSAVTLVQEFNLDGIDIDWEYPGLEGAGNIYRAADQHNFTLLLKTLREGLDSFSASQHKPMLLTIAACADTSFISHTEMKEAQRYLDYVNLMTYDFKTSEDSIAGHHTNLFLSKSARSISSADRSITNYINAGVPARKIVAGVAFYGTAWKVKTGDHHGLYASVLGNARGAGYTKLKDSVIGWPGYMQYWDKDAQAPYLFNASDSTFMSYDDEKSIRRKCRYIQDKQLAGIMFWEYFEDKKCYLLDEIDKAFLK